MSEARDLIKSNPHLIAKAVTGGVIALVLLYIISNSFFYAEPGYIYHVRTVTGNEAVVN